LNLRSGRSLLPEPATITAGWDAAGDWRRGDGQARPALPPRQRRGTVGERGVYAAAAEYMPLERIALKYRMIPGTCSGEREFRTKTQHIRARGGPSEDSRRKEGLKVSEGGMSGAMVLWRLQLLSCIPGDIPAGVARALEVI